MHNNPELTEQRLARVLHQRLLPAVHARSVPLTVEVWHVPGEPVPVRDALAAEYGPARVGDRWGPAWSTSWFRVSGTVPQEWAGLPVEAVLDLGFGTTSPGFSTEGLVYRPDGTAVKAVNPRNSWLPVTGSGDRRRGVRPLHRGGGQPRRHAREPRTHLRAHAGRRARPVAPGRRRRRRRTAVPAAADGPGGLRRRGLRAGAGPGGARPAHARAARATAAPLADPDRCRARAGRRRPPGHPRHRGRRPRRAGPGAGRAGRATARTGSPRSGTRTSTRRGCGRCARPCARWPVPSPTSRSCMDDHPEFKFAMSQAQQLAWLKEHRPEVYARAQEKAKTGQFLPVGSLWVEPDTNITGGEALARQFVHGKRFYLDEFGVETEEMWLPDTFGYNAALPQLMKLAGVRWFLTQKISWNTTNKFPHHTFQWEGIDGTRIFSHFPPVDTYNSDLSGAEIAHSVRNFQDKAGAGRSMAPFGYGDGGGGPTREMLARAARLADLEGSAKVAIETARGLLRRGRGGVPRRAGVGRRAVPGVPPRHPDQPARHQAGQPAQRAPAARGRTVGGHRRVAHRRRLPVRAVGPDLEDRAAAPVPRHPARHRRSPGCTGRPSRPTRTSPAS